MTTILFTGAREWRDQQVVLGALRDLKVGDRVIVGDSRGLDAIVHHLAKTYFSHKLRIDPPYVADWKRYGPAGGPKRNAAMLDEQPDEVWAFHDNLATSKGTRSCVAEAKRRGIPVRMFMSRAAARREQVAR